MGDVLNSANVIVAIIGGVFGIIGGITGAIMFINKAVNEKVTAAIETGKTSLASHATLQTQKDALCEQDRETIEEGLQTVLGKTVLLEKELRSPDTGVYVRLKAVETTIAHLLKGN